MTFYQCVSLESPEIELRLAVLYPGKKYESVHCDVITVTPDLLLEYDISYEALSYCWGKGDARKTIFVGGLSHQVTPNLEHALRHLRRRKEKRILWIDALCINQEDNEEKNKQVPRMGWVYKNATEVVIWVGKDDEKEDHQKEWDSDIWPNAHKISRGSASTTQLAFQFLENLAWFSRQTIATQPHFYHLTMLVDMCKNADHCANIARLFRREWFERMWVIQEVVLAKRAIVVCGYRSIPWTTLDAASKAIINPEITRLVNLDYKFFAMMGQHRVSRVVDCMYKRGIFALLDATQASKFPTLAIHATDARDKLFGVLGLLSTVDAQDIKVDYNLSVVDVYRSWVEKRITRTGTLDALSICANTGRRGFPSWVPDLDHRLTQDLSLFSITHSIIPGPGEKPPTTKFSASGPELANPVFGEEIIDGKMRHTMTIPGRELDTIEYIAPGITTDILPPTGDEDIQDVLEQLEKMLMFSDAGFRRIMNMSRTMDYDKSKTKLYEEFGTTLFRGYSHTNLACSLHAMYECYRGRESIPELLTTSWPPTKTQEFYASFGMYLRSFLYYARFFVTSGGSFGVVSDNCNVTEGDGIWILRGGKTPFVMRQKHEVLLGNTEINTWELMGPCYVYGAMEAKKGVDLWTLEEDSPRTDVLWQMRHFGMAADIRII